MTLSAGTWLGPYEIVASLGAGGMGEVFRAHDTRLQRPVAIKVLADSVRTDPERRQRFLREAQAVAALSHPHIGALHDIGQHGDVDYLVLELIDGETLASRLAERPLSLAEVLTYSQQIAAALDHAHRHGIVHRDLKPQNVMVTKSGVKLLDFGLARLARPLGEAVGALPTVPATLTAEGALLGTLPYMAPEQLEGGEADVRSDIFAFGAVLYEMVAGRRAFEGKSPASIIGAVLRDEPPPLRVLQASTPPALERIVRTCLEKDPDHRFQSAHDAALALRWIAVEAKESLPLAASQRLTHRHVALAVIAAGLALAAGVWIGSRFTSDTTADTAPIRFIVPAPDNQRTVEPALSPDGRYLVLATVADDNRRGLWLRALDSEIAHELEGTAGASFPFWAPDGRAIAFFADGRLKRLDISGGPPIDICAAENPRGGSWSSNGTILFAPSPISPLMKVSASGGTPAPATALSAPVETSHRWPYFLPDGDHFLFFAFAAQQEAKSVVRVGTLSGTTSETILENPTEARYADGLLFFVRENVLVAQPFDVERRRLFGEPRAVVSRPSGLQTGRYTFSLASNGTIAYIQAADPVGNSRLTWLSRNGNALGTVGDAGDYSSPTIAPDQNHIAVSRREGAGADIWMFEGPRWTAVRLTTHPLPDTAPIWSPDGRRIVHSSTTVFGGATTLQVLPFDGAKAPASIHSSTMTLWPRAWLQDDTILFQTVDARGLVSLWTTSARTPREPVPFRNDRFNYSEATVSPDGRWIAYRSDLSGRDAVYVESFPTAANRRQVPGSMGGREPRWRYDGKEVYYVAADRTLMAVPTTLGAAPSFGEPASLFRLRIPGDAVTRGFVVHYDVARDGRFLAILAEGDTRPVARQVVVSLNATAALRGRSGR